MPRAKLLTTGLLATLALGAAATTSAAAPGPTRCADVRGRTLATNERWRIVAAPRAEDWALIVACRLGKRTPLKVRVLGEIDPDYGSDIGIGGLGGDVALVSDTSSASGGGGSTYLLVDLATGRKRAVGGASWESGNGATPFLYAMTADGTVVFAESAHVPEGTREVTGGPGMVFDSQGRRELGVDVVGLAPSLGGGASVSGVYYRAADGRVGRVAGHGAPPSTDWEQPRSLRWRTPRLLIARQRGSQTTEIPASLQPYGGSVEIVTGRGPVAAERPAAIEFHRESGGGPAPRPVSLAPGSADEVHVLARGWNSVMVAARFADAPDERRIRVVGADLYSLAKLDIPATPEAESPGHAAGSFDGTYALANATGLRVWERSDRERMISLDSPGATDMSFDRISLSTVGVFYTSAAGVPSYARIR